MAFLKIRHLSALAALIAPLALPCSAALADSFNSSYTTANGFTVSRTGNYDRSTGTLTRSQTVTGPQGRTASVSVTSAPDGHGGLSVTRSSTGFNGQTHTSSHTVGR